MSEAMRPPPPEIDGARVLYYAWINAPSRPEDTNPRVIAGVPQPPPPAAIAICQYEKRAVGGLYLFGCDTDWNTVSDWDHSTTEEAMAAAENQYSGRLGPWQRGPT